MDKFLADIKKMNLMYDLPIAESPSFLKIIDSEENKSEGAWAAGPTEIILNQLGNFKKILKDELDEIDEIHNKIIIDKGANQTTPEEILTYLSDLFGDLIVYIFSEALKYGIPIMDVLNIIMGSNFSKLDENGNPIKDANGKFLKGPGYWKPEPRIKELLESYKEKGNGE